MLSPVVANHLSEENIPGTSINRIKNVIGLGWQCSINKLRANICSGQYEKRQGIDF